MPSLTKTKSKGEALSGPSPLLPEIGALAAQRAEGLRNIVNQEELKAWLAALARDKLHGTPMDRKAACERWLASVGRNWILKKGSEIPFHLPKKALGNQPAWIKKALQSGAPLQKLKLSAQERERFAGVLDWMRAQDGPGLGTDWSKISFLQAEAAEKGWIEARAKTALKRDLEAADAAGAELFAPCEKPGPDGQLGWRWVEVKSADALDREGALMRHCGGSYADDVAAGRKSVYSLRDPENQPQLTVEAREGELCQLKAFANQECPKELNAMVANFAKAFEERCEKLGWELRTGAEIRNAGVVRIPGAGLAIEGEPLGERVAAIVDGWIEGGVVEKINNALPLLAELGDSARVGSGMRLAGGLAKNEVLAAAAGRGDMAMINLMLPLSDPMADDSGALRAAVKNGHMEMVKLLLPVSDPMADDSGALREAAKNGHMEMVKLLLPVSNPLSGKSTALRWAAKNGHVEMVKLLLPVSDPLAFNSGALIVAAGGGHREIVQLLLPVSDPAATDSEALRMAALNMRLEVVKLLLPVSDPLARDSEDLRLAQRLGRGDMVALIQAQIDANKAVEEASLDDGLAKKLVSRRGQSEQAKGAAVSDRAAP